MIEIEPISNEDDLLKEMNSKPTISDINTEGEITKSPINNTNDQTKKDKIQLPTQEKPMNMRVESYRQITDSDKILDTIDKNKRPFSYKTPASGYVLIWLHLIAITITSVFLLQFVISYTNTMSGNNDLMTFLRSTGFSRNILSCILVIFYCTAIVSFISGSRKILRYLGIALSAAAVGFQIYILVKLFGEYKNFQAILVTFLPDTISLYTAYLPYMLLPISSLIFFSMPKTSKVYR